MRPSFLPSLLLAALPLLPACLSSRNAPKASFAPEIEALNRELERRFRDGDLLGVADIYADNALMIPRGGERSQGREAIDAYWSAIADPIDWRLEIFEIGGSDELAYERGRSHMVRRREGVEHTSVVDFMLLWERHGEAGWKIAVDAYW